MHVFIQDQGEDMSISDRTTMMMPSSSTASAAVSIDDLSAFGLLWHMCRCTHVYWWAKGADGKRTGLPIQQEFKYNASTRMVKVGSDPPMPASEWMDELMHAVYLCPLHSNLNIAIVPNQCNNIFPFEPVQTIVNSNCSGNVRVYVTVRTD